MSNRDVTTDFKTELTAGTNYPFFLFEGKFGDDFLRYCTLGRDLSWDSKTWVGNGYLKGIPQVSETSSVQASGISVVLAGEPSVILSIILNNASHKGTGKLWFGFLNSAGSVISSPHLIFSGLLSSAPITDSISEASVTLNYENQLINILNNNEFRYNNKTQQLFFPTDIGFEYMEALANWTGYWGKKNKRKKKPKKDKGKD